ncbi:MAG: acetylornithine/succinylornithine family transaminase [Terrimicrobiaceae bacterium]
MDGFNRSYEKYVIPTYGRFDLDLVRGSGTHVYDVHGRDYLDFGGGIAVCSLGHAHPVVTEAVSRQAATLVHTSNLYRTGPQADLAQRIVEITGPGKVFFCNSGAEANEGLIKLTRKFGAATGRFGMITFKNSFHGRTMAGISATGQDKVKVGFAPLLEGFSHADLGDMASVRSALTPTTAAVLVEPVQGEGGIHLGSAGFLRELRAFCDDHDLLLLFDEVQCGLGRTGDLCGWKSIAPDVQPDGVSWAKGIANGFPLGAFWAASRPLGDGTLLCDLLGPGTHGTTYGGNPVSCAAGLAVLEVIAAGHVLENVQTMGARLTGALRAMIINLGWENAAVRGLGLIIGMELPPGIAARDLVLALQEEGLLVIPAGERVVRFLPPLNVSSEEIDAAIEIVERTLARVYSSTGATQMA